MIADPQPLAPPPHDHEAEAAVLGAVLLSDKTLPVIAGDCGLRPEHFYRERHRLVYAAMLALHDRGHGVDVLTVCDRLRQRGELDTVGGQVAVDSLAAAVPAAGHARSYAATVADLARWRARLTATYDMQVAVERRDAEAFAAAEAKLAAPVGEGARTYTQADLADRLYQRLEQTEPPERFPWPFRKLNVLSRGGMARGQVTLVAGPTSHGKSVLCDMALESGGIRQTANAHLFLNEMSEEERVARVAGRLAGVSWDRVFSNELRDTERKQVVDALSRMRFGMTESAGWSARDICREARRRRYDLIAVDLVNKLPYRHGSRQQDLAEASVEFNALAKQIGCHVLLVAHVNRNRVDHSGQRPNPTLSDVKDCAALADDADNVLFVWRRQDDDTGDPLPEGVIRFGKGRGIRLGGLDVTFNGELMRFDPVRKLEAAA